MNGPQRTACLAKGCNTGKYTWIEVLVMGKKTMEIETHSLHLWKQVPGVLLRSSTFPATHLKQIRAVKTAAGTATIYIDNMQELGTPPEQGGQAR